MINSIDYRPNKTTWNLLFSWITFAICALMAAGIFAFLVVMARTPYIYNLFPGTDYVRVALVGHVIHAFVIWFLAFMGVLWTFTSTVILKQQVNYPFLAWIGFILSAGGTATIALTAFTGTGKPQFINYIPLLDHPAFYMGLATLMIGMTITVVSTLLNIKRAITSKSYGNRFPLLATGMAIAGIAVLVAFICFGLSFILQKRPFNMELIFWGGGHILQFANTISMVTAWLFLSYLIYKEFPINEKFARFLFLIYLLFILPAPFIYFLYPVKTNAHVHAFTFLMESGLGPSTLIFAIFILYRVLAMKKGSPLPWSRIEFSSLMFSMGLFGLGGLIAFTVYGYNTKTPSHYHGVIGGVTLAFMGLAGHIISYLKGKQWEGKISSYFPYAYGLGQALFVIGMFWAGEHGVARKTFGAGQNLNTAIKIAGMAIVGLGGIIAIIGGILFIIYALRGIFQNRIMDRYIISDKTFHSMENLADTKE